MSKIGLVILFFLLAGECGAQNFFVFIDAGNRQPFYVRIDSQFYSSSAEGHIILSRLRDSLYNITIGFPGRSALEQRYELGIQGKDQAFEIRDHGGDAPGLFDLQTNEWLTTPSKGNVQDEFRPTGIKKDDAFSRMMAGVVHDTAVLYNTYAMEQALSDGPTITKSGATPVTPPATAAGVAPPATATESASSLDSGIARTNTTSATVTTPGVTLDSVITPIITSAPAYPDTANQLYRPITHPTVTDTTTLLYRPAAGSTSHKAAPALDSPGKATAKTPLFQPVGHVTKPIGHVTKLSERRSPRAVRLVYAVQSNGKKADTIIIVIPVDTPHSAVTHSHGQNAIADSPVLGQNTVFRPLTAAGNPSSDKSQPGSPADTQRHPAKGAITYVNSDCHDFATDLDVDKLRAKMLEAGKDDARMAIARKAFKVKCFYTRYIRALSEVFTTDAAKYRFFEAAWPFAADEHFHELSNLLADPIYSGKFRALTGHP